MTSSDRRMLSIGASVRFTNDALLFNASALYRENYYCSLIQVRSGKDIRSWRIALECLLASPILNAVMTLLKREADSRVALKLTVPFGVNVFQGSQAEQDDVYLHTGFLALALVDLRCRSYDTIYSLHTEIRDFVADTVRYNYTYDRRMIIPSKDLKKIVDSSEASMLSNVAECIIRKSNAGLISIGGIPAIFNYAVIPQAWITVPTLGFDKLSLNPLQRDATLLIDVALHIIYTSLEASLAKRVVLTPQCKRLGLAITKPLSSAGSSSTTFFHKIPEHLARKPSLIIEEEDVWSPEARNMIDRILAE